MTPEVDVDTAEIAFEIGDLRGEHASVEQQAVPEEHRHDRLVVLLFCSYHYLLNFFWFVKLTFASAFIIKNGMLVKGNG